MITRGIAKQTKTKYAFETILTTVHEEYTSNVFATNQGKIKFSAKFNTPTISNNDSCTSTMQKLIT